MVEKKRGPVRRNVRRGYDKKNNKNLNPNQREQSNKAREEKFIKEAADFIKKEVGLGLTSSKMVPHVEFPFDEGEVYHEASASSMTLAEANKKCADDGASMEYDFKAGVIKFRKIIPKAGDLDLEGME